MKRVLVGAALLITAAVGITTPSPVAAEQAESPAGAEREVAARLGNGHTNACIVLDNEQVRCWGTRWRSASPAPESSATTRHLTPFERSTSVRVARSKRSTVARGSPVCCSTTATFVVGVRRRSDRCSAARSQEGSGSATARNRRRSRRSRSAARRPRSRRATSARAPSSRTARCAAGARTARASSVTATRQDRRRRDAGAGGARVARRRSRRPPRSRSAAIHACVILDTGDVRCWGDGNAMPGSNDDIGDDELPSAVPVVDLGGNKAVAISAGQSATCAVVEGGDVWCWGSGTSGAIQHRREPSTQHAGADGPRNTDRRLDHPRVQSCVHRVRRRHDGVLGREWIGGRQRWTDRVSESPVPR